jgi:competence protein ComEC
MAALAANATARPAPEPSVAHRHPGLLLAALFALGLAAREAPRPVPALLGAACALAIAALLGRKLWRRFRPTLWRRLEAKLWTRLSTKLGARLRPGPARARRPEGGDGGGTGGGMGAAARDWRRSWAFRGAGFVLLGLLRAGEPAPPAVPAAPAAPAAPAVQRGAGGGDAVVVTGTVTTPPATVEAVRDGRAVLETRFALRLPGGRRVRVTCAGEVPRIEGGDLVEAAGILVPGRGARNPGDPERPRDPLLVVRHPASVRRLGPDRVLGAAGAARGALFELLGKLYDERPRAFLLALILGDRRLLSPATQDALEVTGSLHMLAISGVHVGILMFYLVRVPLPRRLRSAARLGFLAVFSLLTGGSPPVLRAALMLSVQLLLEGRGYRPFPLNTLGWTALVLLAFDPALLHDVGFRLSFAGVFFILTWGRPRRGAAGSGARDADTDSDADADTDTDTVASTDGDAGDLSRTLRSRLLRRARGRAALASGLRGPLSAIPGAILGAFLAALRVSLAAWLGSTPLILYHFSRFHPLAPLWSVLAAPFLAVSLVGGSASLALGLVHPAVAWPAALVAGWAAEGFVMLLEAAALVPGNSVPLPPPPAASVITAYAILILAIAPRLRRAALALGAGALAVALAAFLLAPRAPEAWFFAVGGGDAALVAVPGAGALLIDAGAPGDERAAGRVLARAVLASGHDRLGGAFITHAHADHLRGLDGLSLRLSIERIWGSPYLSQSEPGRRAATALAARGRRLEILERGARLCFPEAPGLSIDVLHPQAGETLPFAGSANDTSLAMRIDYRGSSILFLGDLEEAGLARLFKECAGRESLREADVLLVPHHGRANRLWRELIARTRPRAVVISGSGDGGAVETARAIEALGIPVHATWKGGAVRLTWRPDRGWEAGYWRHWRRWRRGAIAGGGGGM